MFLNFLFNKKKKKSKKIGLVLGGGGARGFFHIGVIKALRELNVEIDEMVCSSVGALIGLMYSANPSINFEKIISDLNVLDVFTKVNFKNKRPVDAGIVYLFEKYIKVKNFSDLKIPLFIVAADAKTYNFKSFSKNDILLPLIASVSMPGASRPVKIKNKYYFDSSTFSSSPISQAHLDNKTVFVSDLCPSLKFNWNIIEAIFESASVAQGYNFSKDLNVFKEKSKAKIFLFKCDPMSVVFDFRKKTINKLISSGYNEVMKNKEKIIKSIK